MQPTEGADMAFIAGTAPYALPADAGLADVWWKTGRIKLKATGEQTGGRFSQVETLDPRGAAPPLHVHHNEEETFYVLEGEVSVMVDGERLDVSAGGFALVPRGVPHAYVVRSEQARMLVTFSPAGFEEAFVDLGVDAAESAEPPVETVMPPVEEIVRAFAPYGCEIVGPPPAL
jgi:quercetin dioxygenase-like cupin family protein